MAGIFDSNATNDFDITEISIKGLLGVNAADVTDENRLKVDAIIPPQSYVSDLKFEEMNASTGGISRNSILPSSFTNIYSYSGSGLFFGFHANFEDEDKTWVSVSVDGEQILLGVNGIKLGDLKDNNILDIQDIGTYTDFCGLAMHHKSLRICFKVPMRFESSVVIQARHEDGNKRFRAGIANILKD